MKINLLNIAMLSLILVGCAQAPSTFKDAYADKFLVGTAVSVDALNNDPAAMQLVKEQFNTVVAENCMKSGEIQAVEGEFDFTEADKLMDFALENGIVPTGHCLVWHSQAPSWFFTDSEGNLVTPEVLTQRMKRHIYTVVEHFKGKVTGWDVVNEAFEDDGSYRQSMFYRILGPDYIKMAFRFAQEADPNVELYYNDFNMYKEGKRNAVVKLIRELKAEGLRIDAIGMQAHIGLTWPEKWSDFENSIKAFAAEGCQVMLTELDMTVLPDNSTSAAIDRRGEYSKEVNPYPDELPDSIYQLEAQRYDELFDILLRNHEKISRVTFWGINDGYSWRNDWPIEGRTDYPLLIDRNNRLKPITEQMFKKAIK